MKLYRCPVAVEIAVAVEAETLAEAERIIDGVLSNADTVHIVEGDFNNPDDELIGAPSNIRRGRVSMEQ